MPVIIDYDAPGGGAHGNYNREEQLRQRRQFAGMEQMSRGFDRIIDSVEGKKREQEARALNQMEYEALRSQQSSAEEAAQAEMLGPQAQGEQGPMTPDQAKAFEYGQFGGPATQGQLELERLKTVIDKMSPEAGAIALQRYQQRKEERAIVDGRKKMADAIDMRMQNIDNEELKLGYQTLAETLRMGDMPMTMVDLREMSRQLASFDREAIKLSTRKKNIEYGRAQFGKYRSQVEASPEAVEIINNYESLYEMTGDARHMSDANNFIKSINDPTEDSNTAWLKAKEQQEGALQSDDAAPDGGGGFGTTAWNIASNVYPNLPHVIIPRKLWGAAAEWLKPGPSKPTGSKSWGASTDLHEDVERRYKDYIRHVRDNPKRQEQMDKDIESIFSEVDLDMLSVPQEEIMRWASEVADERMGAPGGEGQQKPMPEEDKKAAEEIMRRGGVPGGNIRY